MPKMGSLDLEQKSSFFAPIGVDNYVEVRKRRYNKKLNKMEKTDGFQP